MALRKAVLFRHIVRAALGSRQDMYRDPALQNYSANSGNAINGKLQQLLKKFNVIQGAAAIVAEEVAALSKNKKSTPTKPKAMTATTPKPKKRKIVKNESEDELSEEV